MKLLKILLPLDGSPLSERALPSAEIVARASGATVVLMRAAAAPTFLGNGVGDGQGKVLREAEAYLQGVAERLEARGFKTEIAVPYGNPAEWIVEEVPLRHIDLVVMATHGRSGPGRWVYGSVAEAVLARSPVPVLLVRSAHAEPAPAAATLAENPRILVPLDGSTFAEAALPVARGMAETLGAEIVLMSAVAPPHSVVMDDSGQIISYIDQSLAALEADARSYLSGVTASMVRDDSSLTPRTEVAVGEPAEAIAEAARALKPVLIVMATHGRTGVARALLGSVAGQVLQRGTTPVVLVRPGPPPLFRELLAPHDVEAETTSRHGIALQLTAAEADMLGVALRVYSQTASRHAHVQEPIRRIQEKLDAYP